MGRLVFLTGEGNLEVWEFEISESMRSGFVMCWSTLGTAPLPRPTYLEEYCQAENGDSGGEGATLLRL